MPKFNYVAMDSKGKEVSGVLDADSSTAAITRIREMGHFPTNVSEANAGKEKEVIRKGTTGSAAGRMGASKKGRSMEINLFGGGTVKAKVLTTTTRQLSTLIEAGLPLLRGLDVLRKGERNPIMKRTLASLADTVEGGSTFSEALSQHPKIFNRLYVNMVRAGEAGGVLDVTLNRLAEFQEKAQKIKNKVVSAMVYPTVVICVAMVIVMFLMIFIVPKFQDIFKELAGADLPALTLIVLAFSNACKNYWYFVIAGVVALVVFIRILGKTTRGRYLLDSFKLNAPVMGQLTRKVSIARFTRTLGTLIASGVPILQALNIVKETSGNAVVANAIARVHDAVKEGERIVEPLEASKVFPPMVVSMVDVGEETGALPDMLMKIADVYDDEVDNAVSALTSLLEPIMIVFLAIIVGTIVIAMFLPLISIMGKIG